MLMVSRTQMQRTITAKNTCRQDKHGAVQKFFLWEGMVNFEGRYDVEKARVWDFEANAAPAFVTGVCGYLAMPSSEHPRQCCFICHIRLICRTQSYSL